DLRLPGLWSTRRAVDPLPGHRGLPRPCSSRQLGRQDRRQRARLQRVAAVVAPALARPAARADRRGVRAGSGPRISNGTGVVEEHPVAADSISTDYGTTIARL